MVNHNMWFTQAATQQTSKSTRNNHMSTISKRRNKYIWYAPRWFLSQHQANRPSSEKNKLKPEEFHVNVSIRVFADWDNSTSLKAPEILYLDLSNSSQDTTNLIHEQQFATHANNNASKQTSTIPHHKPQLQMKQVRSPPTSSVYRTPPSSLRSESISDLNEGDMMVLNKI